jgi:hypothetical protein
MSFPNLSPPIPESVCNPLTLFAVALVIKVLHQLLVARYIQQDLGFHILGEFRAFVNGKVSRRFYDDCFHLRDMPDITLSKCTIQIGGGDTVSTHDFCERAAAECDNQWWGVEGAFKGWAKVRRDMRARASACAAYRYEPQELKGHQRDQGNQASHQARAIDYSRQRASKSDIQEPVEKRDRRYASV